VQACVGSHGGDVLGGRYWCVSFDDGEIERVAYLPTAVRLSTAFAGLKPLNGTAGLSIPFLFLKLRQRQKRRLWLYLLLVCALKVSRRCSLF
jgi:hypothetical protein